jgi:hypothetical protein
MIVPYSGEAVRLKATIAWSNFDISVPWDENISTQKWLKELEISRTP